MKGLLTSSVLLLLAAQLSAIPCNISRAAVPSVVQDTEGASQLAEAVNCSGGVFDVEWVGSVTVSEPIAVGSDTVLTMWGAAGEPALVDGANQIGLFVVHESTLHLSNLTIANGQGYYGGAIDAYIANITLVSCVFFGNNATNGGAVAALNSTVRVLGDTIFKANFAMNYGGGILIESNASITVDKYAIWEANEAGIGGGAILAYLASVTINDGTFVSNNSSAGGGAIYTYEADASVTSCTFVGNNAEYGGAIFAGGMSTMHVLGDTVFTDNAASDTGGGIYAEDQTLLVVDGNALWERNWGVFGGGICLYKDCLLSVSGSATFVRNSGTQGAGVWLYVNSTMQALGSSALTFYSNTVSEFGGGMLVYDAKAEFLAGSTVIFSNNTAALGGGGLCVWGNTALRHYGVIVMSGNTASSGGAIYGEATEDLVITNTKFISNVATASGGAVTFLSAGRQGDFSIITNSSFHRNTAGDAGGAVFNTGGFIHISESDFVDNAVGRAGGAVRTSGFTRLSGCVFSGNRGYTGPAISNTVTMEIHSAEFDGNALFCGDGLFLHWATNVSAYETACDPCPVQEECSECVVHNPDTAQLCELAIERTTSPTADGTLESLEVQAGYWRSSNTSKDIRECYEADACIGGTEGYCETGYMGPFCTVCIEGYARGMGRTCSKCTSRRRTAGVIIAAVVVIVVIAIVGLRVRFIASPSTDVNTERTASSRGLPILRSPSITTRPSQAVKIIVVSWQIITQFSTVASVTYPQVYDSFLCLIDVANLNLGWMLSAGCLVETDFYDGLLLSTLMPLVIGCFVLASYVVSSWKYPVEDQAARARLKRRFGAFFFWVTFLLYTTTSSAVFHTFACDNLDNGESFLRIDHRLSCHTEKHKFYMAYAAVMGIVYPLGIPFCYMFVLYHSRSRLKTVGREDDTEVAAFRDLWLPYRHDAYYYEVIECLRRIVLSGIVVFIFPNTAGQVATAFLLALVFCGVLMSLNPHHDRWDAWLARAGHVIVMMSMFVALLQKVDISDDDVFSRDVFAGVLVLANCGMILAVAAEASGICFTTITDFRPSVLPGPVREREGVESSSGESAVDASRDADEASDYTTRGEKYQVEECKLPPPVV